jgi:pyruvate dehydrogenase E2 component (dihydrolipoamide acetyltransferase)
MAEVNMPRLSDTMEEGTISRWLKKPGDEIKRGDIIAEVETDKANMEVEAFDAGTLEEILVQEGETAPIGQVIAIIGSGAGAAKSAKPASAKSAQAASTSAASVQASAAPAQPAKSVSAPVAGSNGVFIKASPLARRMAEEHGINLGALQGTGPGGRIVRDDIEDFIAKRGATTAPAGQSVAVAPAAPVASDGDAEIVNLTSTQKTIVRRMIEAKQNVPHIYIRNEIDMTEALALRVKLNTALAEDGVKISVNDMVVKASALALEKFPEVNGSYRDGQFVLHKKVNVGIAVDIPGSLVVPVIFDANIKGLRTIAREAKALVAKAQAGKLTVNDMNGGTFSISNLGMMDVTDFDAVINSPQSAIMAVGASRKTFVPIDNQPVVRDIMRVTVSADHRILYGAVVARFLQEVKRLLQNPYLLLG